MKEDKQLLTEGVWNFVDLGIIFYIGKKLVTPFNKWSAFSLGIIDEKGKTIKSKLVTSAEHNAFTLLDKFIRNLRLLLGDNTFLKLSLASLLAMDFKSDKKVIKEERVLSPEEILFSYIKENVQKNEVSIDCLLSTIGENVYFFYNNVSTDNASINIAFQYGNNIVSSISGNYLNKESIKLFLNRLNYIFNNLDLGGYETISLNDGLTNIDISVTFGKNEIKVKKVGNSNLIHADLYLLFDEDKQRTKFIEAWNRFYKTVKEIS